MALTDTQIVDDLTQQLREEDDAPAEGLMPEATPFVPDTAEKVDWVLGRIADHRARAVRIRENAELMAKEADRQAADMEWHYGPALQAFLREQVSGGKKKSLRLFHGVLGYRTKPAGITVGDEGAAIAWAKTYLPDAVVERLDKKALADTLLADGEVHDFATLHPAEEVFYIK